MDSQKFQAHVDARFDRLEAKMDTVAERTITHKEQIEHLQGFSKLIISILLAVFGFVAIGYVTFLKG